MLVLGMVILWLGNQSYHAQAQSAPLPAPEHPTVTVRADGVAIEWHHTDQTTSVRYALLRGATPELADAQPITAALLSSIDSSTPVITYYTLLDYNAEANTAYAYWLTLTDGQGQQATFGPYTIGQVDDASEQYHALFLPLISSVAGAG